MDQRHIPYRNKAINNPKAYFWTTDDEPEFVREVTEADIANPVPKGYEVRQDLPIVIAENVTGSGPALITAYQHWNIPTIEEGETYGVSAIPLGDERDVTNLINALIRVRNERWPLKSEAQQQEEDPYSYGGTYRHPLDMD